MALRYIKRGGLASIKLALSKEGGVAGERQFPLMQHQGSWQALTEACRIQVTTTTNAPKVLAILDGASGSKVIVQIMKLIADVCEACREHWNRSGSVLDPGLVKLFVSLSDKSGTYIAAPWLEKSWKESCGEMMEASKRASGDAGEFDLAELASWLQMASLISLVEPRLLKKPPAEEFDTALDSYVEALGIALEEEIDEDEDEDEFLGQGQRFEELRDVVLLAVQVFRDRAKELESLALRLEDRSDQCREEGTRRAYEPPDDDRPDFSASRQEGKEVSWEKIFDDL